MPDYPKIGMWPDGYYVTWNMFAGGTAFTGAETCAWDRVGMLSGVAAPQFVCFNLSSAYSSLLPSDFDGALPPPGSPNFLMNIDPGSSALNLWKFHVDFATPRNSTLVGPISIPGTAPFVAPCPDTQDCIPQPATTESLDALGDRLMYRLAYRNFGDHESIVANHTVVAGSGVTGVRWYEVRNPNSGPTIYQQGTFAPDADNRWMASIAMDQTGNIGVGYSLASGGTFPSIRYTGWEVGNPLGTLQDETSFVAGGGSQTGYNRWGDYSAMRIDPNDDCTFWYTQEYQATTQTVGWSTRIGSFRFASCGQSQASTTTTVASSLPSSAFGQSVTFTASVTPSGATGTVQFFDGANPLGSLVLSGGTASLTTSALAVGPHSITASYGGDANFAGSTSSSLSQTVGAVSTATALTSSLDPSVFGQQVTFTATVSPSSGPTGTVQFFDGVTSLGTAALSGGTALMTTSALAVGTHFITANYSGNASYTGSTFCLSHTDGVRGHGEHKYDVDVVTESVGVRTAGDVHGNHQSVLGRRGHGHLHGWRLDARCLSAQRERRSNLVNFESRRRHSFHHRTVQRRWQPLEQRVRAVVADSQQGRHDNHLEVQFQSVEEWKPRHLYGRCFSVLGHGKRSVLRRFDIARYDASQQRHGIFHDVDARRREAFDHGRV